MAKGTDNAFGGDGKLSAIEIHFFIFNGGFPKFFDIILKQTNPCYLWLNISYYFCFMIIFKIMSNKIIDCVTSLLSSYLLKYSYVFKFMYQFTWGYDYLLQVL